MDTGYVTVLKDDGNFQDIHINDTFFIKDILVNKTWNDMNMEERTVKLVEIKAYSPRFVGKSWQELPRELKVVLEDTAKDALRQTGFHSNIPKEEDQTYAGQATRARINGGDTGSQPARDTNSLEYDDAYPKGVTQPTGKKPTLAESGDDGLATALEGTGNNDKPKGVKYGDYQSHTMRSGKSPKDMETKKSNVEQGHLGTAAGNPESGVETNQTNDATDDYEGQTEDEKKEQFKHEAKKPVTKTIQEQLWEDWLNKETMSGGDSSPAQTAITTGTTGMYNAVYGKDGRIKGQSKDKDEERTEKDKEEKEKERKG
jgi:hypothetical protein